MSTLVIKHRDITTVIHHDWLKRHPVYVWARVEVWCHEDHGDQVPVITIDFAEQQDRRKIQGIAESLEDAQNIAHSIADEISVFLATNHHRTIKLPCSSPWMKEANVS